MPLTDKKVRNARAESPKPFQKFFDERGMYLLVTAKGQKYWRMDFRLHGKRKTAALGAYPEISLKEARERRDNARKLIRNGQDPIQVRKAVLRTAAGVAANSFETIAREWIEKFRRGWAESHAEKVLGRLERNVFPYLGGRPIADISAPELLTCLRRIEAKGTYETAHRTKQNCGQVFRYAIATGRALRDTAADLKGALAPRPKDRHHASITEPRAIGGLLRAIEGYDGAPAVRAALQVLPLVFVRPGELRYAQWSEIDLDAAEWRIPASRMKSRQTHIVPLSTQAVAILRALHPLTSRGKLLFPSIRSLSRPISENTINAALRRLGYSKDQMTGHGFRSMASTRLNEMGWNRDAIERQLAHAERDDVRAAYNFAEHLPERRRMMQAWADYLDGLKAGGGDVTAIRRAA